MSEERRSQAGAADSTEVLLVDLPNRQTAVVKGWRRDRRRYMDLLVALPDGRTLRAEGSRKGGWIVVLDHDHFAGGGRLNEMIALALGYQVTENWPRWIDRLADAILQ